jgi:DNA replication initiation complex subunit (GINS family)
MEELTYEELRRIQARERASPVLQSLPQGFYKAVKKLIETKSSSLKNSFSLTEAKEYENIVKVVEDIYERRKQKIVLRAMRSGEEAALADEEREFFSKIRKVIEEEADNFKMNIGAVEGEKESIKRIRILKHLPKFVGSDLKVYGPFEEGASVELPEKEAQLLVKKGVAEYTGGVGNEVPK